MSTVQCLAVDDIEFLETHDVILYFSGGKKIGMQWRRPDGLLLGASGWTVGEVINEARTALRKWREQ